MTPAQAIAALARQLDLHGQTVTLQRLSVGTPQTIVDAVEVRALMRGIGQASDLVNVVTQANVMIIIGPAEIIADGWTSGAPAGNDQRIPIKGNRVVAQDRTRNVETVRPVYLDGQLVRIEIIARG